MDGRGAAGAGRGPLDLNFNTILREISPQYHLSRKRRALGNNDFDFGFCLSLPYSMKSRFARRGIVSIEAEEKQCKELNWGRETREGLGQ